MLYYNNRYQDMFNLLEKQLDHNLLTREEFLKFTAEFLEKASGNIADNKLYYNIFNELQQTYENTKKSALYNYNKDIKTIYIKSFFTHEAYEKTLKNMKKNSFMDNLNDRLKYNAPLLTFDYLILLKNSDKKIDQTKRAATLIRASIDLHIEFQKGNLKTRLQNGLNFDNVAYWAAFGVAVTSKEFPNSLCVSKSSKHIAVLNRGMIYRLDIIKNNEPLSLEEITANLDSIKKNSKKLKHRYLTGALTSGDRQLCYNMRKKLTAHNANKEAYNTLDSALFVLCLDDENYKTNQTAAEMYIKNYYNRCFGRTQIVVSKDGAAGVISSYLKGFEGQPTTEVVDEIVFRSNKMDIILDNQSTFQVNWKAFPIEIDREDAKILEESTNRFIHSNKYEYKLNIGANYFKQIGIGPNIGFNMLLALAVSELNEGKIPVISQAVACSAKEFDLPIKLDWIYICPKLLYDFLVKYKNNDITMSLYLLFKNAVKNHLQYMNNTKKNLSPTYFIIKPEGDFFDLLCNYFLLIGSKSPAYRYYLFRPYRNNKSLDIITSSLPLAEHFESISRAGTTSIVLRFFGLMYSMSNNEIILNIIPNKNWIDNIPALIEKINEWSKRIQYFFDLYQKKLQQDI